MTLPRRTLTAYESAGKGRGAIRAGVLLLVAMTTSGVSFPVRAQTPAPARNVSDDDAGDRLLRALELKARPSSMPDFVRQSRPASTDFIPTGRLHPERPIRLMTPAEVEAQTNALDSARVAQQRRAGVPSPVVPLKTAKAVAGTPKAKTR